MVYTFIIQTLSPKSCDILYYRFYTCYYVQGHKLYANQPTAVKEDTNPSPKMYSSESKVANRFTKLYETSQERKDFLQLIADKVNLQYTMKLKHSLLPVHGQDSSVSGTFIERNWKKETSVAVSVVWQSAGNMAFVLVLKKCENTLQAHNILDIMTRQLEKHLQLITNPVVSLTSIETVSLIIDQFLPSGEIIFMNSKLLKVFEKQLEANLYTR